MEDHSKWELTISNLDTYKTTQEVFDAVVVANGRYNELLMPGIPGLKLWEELFPNSISHSRFYRGAEAFRDKVGYSPAPHVIQSCTFSF